jgi:hypothetical protein
MVRRLLVAAITAAVTVSLSATIVSAGEITGNGKVLKVEDSKWGTGLHGRSFCAYSGQEDLQFLDEEGAPLDTVVKGVPSHSQSWGRIPKADRDFLATIGMHPGTACNPTQGSGEG